MFRKLDKDIEKWANRKNRHPLQLFLNEKKRDLAVRFNADVPSFIPRHG